LPGGKEGESAADPAAARDVYYRRVPERQREDDHAISLIRANRRREYVSLLYCRKTHLTDLHFHDLRHTFVTRKVREGWDYKRIMAITGHTTFATFQRYNNPTEDDLKAVVLADPSRKMVG